MANVYYRRLRRLRICTALVFMVLLTLTILDAGLGVTHLGEWLVEAQLIPAILAGSALWLVLWVVITLSVGRVYCSTVCPLGTMQDCAAYLGRRLTKGARRRYRYSPPIDRLRYPIPIIVAVCLFAGFTVVAEVTDPYATYARIVLAVARPAAVGLGSVIVAAVLAVCISFVAWRRGRILCNTICPAGGLLCLLGRQPVYRIDINTDKCIHCDLCVDVCKSSCIRMPDATVDNSRCVMCLNCTAICPNDAITLRRGRHLLSTPMMQIDSGTQ